MLPDIISFLSKLPPIPPGYAMEKAGSRVETALALITGRFPLRPLEDRMQLAILLQHSHPSNYTDNELLAVLSLRLPLLDSNPDVAIPTVLTPYKGFYDTGSYRAYNQLTENGLSQIHMSYLYARSLSYSPRNIIWGALNA